MSTMSAVRMSVLSLCVAMAVLAQGKSGEFVTKETTGEAAIINGNEAMAEKEARERALREAVEQVAGILVEADTLTANSQLISDRVFANSAGFVRSYDVLKTEKEKGVVRVTVRAEVGTKELDKELQVVKALIKRLGNRKLVILLQEQTYDSKGSAFSSGATATVLTEAFRQDGWTIIDGAFASGQLDLASGVSMGTPEVKRIKDLTKADYILYGAVNFRQAEPDSMLKSSAGQSYFPVSGEYDLTVFATDSGTQLGKVVGRLNFEKRSENGIGKSITSYERTALELVKTRGGEIVGQVRAQVIEALRNAEQNGNRVAITVLGLGDYGAVQAFKRAMVKSVTGVRDVNPGNFADGKASFEVVFVGTTEDFADRMSGTSFNGKKLNITGLTGNTVQVSVAK
jgi:hypothetical protein